MPAHSPYLARLNDAARKDLELKLLESQSGKCFLCDEPIDLQLQARELAIDHVVPLVHQGPDEPHNFALMHLPCNTQKGAANLEIARILFRFEKLQDRVRGEHERGASLHHVLDMVGATGKQIRLRIDGNEVSYALGQSANPKIHKVPMYHDSKSGMRYFFSVFPIDYLHHDDKINPRTIGGSLKGLMEEFYAGRPQLHVSLAWWSGGATGEGPIKVFDGQHKAAAQILLGTKELPVRVFVEPDIKKLLQANTNAGDKLKQVAFDMAVKRHLGSALYMERLAEYRAAKGLPQGDEHFSEADLIKFFRGAKREVKKYILDSVRNAITQDPGNKLMEYVEMAGKGVERPLSYSAIEKTFFSLFLYLDPLDTALDHLSEAGRNPRSLEHTQIVRLMNLIAEELVAGRWDPEVSSNKLEYSVTQGEAVPEKHLRAHRMTREEVLHALLTYVVLIIKHFYAFNRQMIDDERLMHTPHPEPLWEGIRNFLANMSLLPCWVDRSLAGTVFGSKQSRDYWLSIFKTGSPPNEARKVLAQPIDLQKMISSI